jgi:death on curing protein
MKYLDVDDLELIHLQIIDASGGAHGTRDRNLLNSAIATQHQNIFGEALYATVEHKAAALCRGIIADHPFVDGNKRTGIITALIFLEQNKVVIEVDDSELEDFAVQIAVDRLSVDGIAAKFHAWSSAAC